MIDLNSLDRQVLMALHRLKDPEHQALFRWFEAELESAKHQLVSAVDTDRLRQLQGRAGAFRDIVGAVNDASKVLNRQ